MSADSLTRRLDKLAARSAERSARLAAAAGPPAPGDTARALAFLLARAARPEAGAKALGQGRRLAEALATPAPD
jgi:hypothetical protein